MDYKEMFLLFNQNKYLVKIYDSSGQERFVQILKQYINKMDIVLIVFDANDKGDLNRRYYEAYLEKRTKSVKLIFVATKIKSKRVYSWSHKDRLEFISKLIKEGDNYNYIEIDCKENYNIDKFIDMLTRTLFDFEEYSKNFHERWLSTVYENMQKYCYCI